MQLAVWISGPDPGPDPSPDEQEATEGGAPGGGTPEELTGWMLGVKDDEIQKQGCQIEELKRQVAASRDEELRIRAQTYWMHKVKDDEIQEKNRLIGELRSHMREKEEHISIAKAKLQSWPTASAPPGSDHPTPGLASSGL